MKKIKVLTKKIAAFSLAVMMAFPVMDYASLFGYFPGGSVVAQAATTSSTKQIKNIIYMVPDGGGYPLYDISAAVKESGGIKCKYTSSFTGTKVDSSNSYMYMKDYFYGSVKTYAANNSVTDSAAAGTALATGNKTNTNYVGIKSDKTPVASILELAQLEGKATGIAVTSYIYDATPAGFTAHNIKRSNYSEILKQMEYTGLNVVLGGGLNYSGYVGSGNDSKVSALGYTLVSTENELREAAANASEDCHIWSAFSATSHHMPYDFQYGSTYDGINDTAATSPTLAEMTKCAIDALEEDKDGFFLMVEGSKIDYAGHAGSTIQIASEYIAFDEAFKVALDYAKDRNDTIIVVVPDHNTGVTATPGTSVMDNIISAAQNGNAVSTSSLSLSSGSASYPHTGDNVGICLYLPDGIDVISGLSETNITDSGERNSYVIENTDIAPYLANLISDMTLEDVTKELYVDVTAYASVSSNVATITGPSATAKATINTDIVTIGDNTIDMNGKLTIQVDGSKVYTSKELAEMLGISEGKDLKGSGTKSDPYLIDGPEDFLLFTNKMKSGNTFSGKYIKQTANIDMSEISGYTGIGLEATFAGTYDGQGHRINVDITGNISNGIAVFPYTTGMIKNLGTTGQITNTSTDGGCGGIVRSARDGSVIVNCWSTVDLSSSNGCGGIAWTIKSGATVMNCYYKGKITATKNYGIGYLGTGSTITNCLYQLENGSTETIADYTSGTAVTSFPSATLNSYQSEAVNEIDNLSTTKELCNFADIEGEEFAFAGSVARLSDFTYTYTTKSGAKKTLSIPGFTTSVTGYSISAADDINSKYAIELGGTGLNACGSTIVKGDTIQINEYGFASGEVEVTATVSNDYYTTTSKCEYGVNISGPIPGKELSANIYLSPSTVVQGGISSVSITAEGGTGNYSYTIYECNADKTNARVVANTNTYTISKDEIASYYYYATVNDGENIYETEVLKFTVREPAGEYEIIGSGTAADPYVISREEQFITFTNALLSGETYNDKYIIQTKDIDMSLFANYLGTGNILTSDGITATFAGTYNGQGHTINIDYEKAWYNAPSNGISIFPNVSGTIMNLGTTGRIHYTGTGNASGLVYTLLANGSITNCWSTVDLLLSGKGSGLAIDFANSSKVVNSYYKGTISSTYNYGLGYANEKAVFEDAYYCMETGSTAVESNHIGGSSSSDFKASKLNAALTANPQFCEYVDVTGEDFAFAGNIGRLNEITYSYTDKNGKVQKGTIEGFNAYSREYTLNLTDMDTSKEVKLDGKAIDLKGNATVTGSSVIVGNDNEARATVAIESKVSTPYYTTNSITKYYINITTNSGISLKNADFESGTSGWTVHSTNSTIVPEGIDGGNCLKISNTSYCYEYLSQYVQLEPDTNYVLTGYVKSDGTFENDGAAIDVEECYGYEYDQENNWLRGTNDWTFVRVYFTTSYTGKVEVRCRLGHGWNGSYGTAYFDNLAIEKLDYPADETVSRVLYETDDVIMAISKSIVNVIGMDDYVKVSDMMQKCYEAEADLIGSTPFNGAKAIIINDNQPTINNFGGIGNGNPVRLSYDQLQYFEDYLNGEGSNFAWTHELGHVFEKVHNDNSSTYSYNFHSEFWTNTKMLYLLDTVNELQVQINGRCYQSSNDIATYYKSLSDGGYDNFIKSGKFTSDYYDALTYIFIEIKNEIGWEPFKATFRQFVNNKAELTITNGGNVFERYMELLQENYNPDGTEVIDTIGKDIYNMILNGMDYVPTSNVEVAYSSKSYGNTEFSDTVYSGSLTGLYNQDTIMTAVKICLPDYEDGIYYKAYIDNEWTDWMSDNEIITGNDKGEIQAIKIKLNDELSKEYDVYYRTANRFYGYLGWACNGEAAGSMVNSGAIEALQITIIEKDSPYDNLASDTLEPCKGLTKSYYVYFENTSGWSTPYIYMWNSSSDRNGAWPGEAMTCVDSEKEIWRYEIESADRYAKCIFSNKGSSKTEDLLCPGAGYMYNKKTGEWSEYGEEVYEDDVVLVKHVDNLGNLLYKEVLTGKSGDSYTTNAKTFDGYTIKTTPSNASGIYEKDIITVKYVYSKICTSKWVQIDSKWYYFDDYGNSVVGWKNISGKWYYFDSTGEMQVGWKKIDGKWYYLNTSMQTGWQKVDGKWYYLNASMQTGWQKVDGKWYYMDTTGVMQTGWQKIDGKWYYLNASMKTGWQKIDGKWYYMNESGVMETGWQKINGKWYYLNASMKTGWQKIDDVWYYFDELGAMQSSKWVSGIYYVKADGSMAVSEWVDSGKYYVGEDGKWIENYK